MAELKRTIKNKDAKRVGRGSKRGKTSGRGTKGQRARAGHKIRPMLRDMIKKLPKLRGRGKNVNKAFRLKSVAVNLSVINAAFTAGTFVTPGALFDAKLIRRVGGKIPAVKILGTGEVTNAYEFYDLEVSAAAKAKIEAAGGKVNG